MLHASRFNFRLRATPLAAALACALLATGTGDAMAAAASSAAAAAPSPRYALRLASHRLRASGLIAHTAPPAPSGGTTLPVTSCLDDADPGTLRNVLAGAAEGDTVDLGALTCSTITLTQGPLDSSALGEHQLYDVTLQGPGRDALTIDGGGQSQVLVVGGFSSDKGIFTANDLTIANGSYDGSLAACVEGFGGAVVLNRVAVTNCQASGTYRLLFGGAVDVTTLRMTDSTISNSSVTGNGVHSSAAGGGAYVSDEATLVRSTISGNSVSAPYANYSGYASVGGGLYSRGNLTLIDSTISGNSIEATNAGEDAPGGGIYVRGVATIAGSTIDDNRADGDGGGLFKAIFSVYGDPPPPQDTQLLVTNSTISGNTAAHGAGIATSRPLYLANSTIALNSSTYGAGGVMFLLAGVLDSSAILDLESSIVATNVSGGSDGAAFAPDIDADDVLAVSGANNLVQAVGGSIALPADTLSGDPLLLPLALNGGATRTHALGTGSVAIDTGNNAAALDFDQRGAGFARVSGAAADIGAFEIQQPPDDVIFKDGFDGAAPGTFEYAYDDGDGDTNQGPPSTFDPDMLWGNYYLAQPGGEIITSIAAAFGPTFPSLANGPVTFWLLEDDDGDFDPRNAHVIASVPATPDVFNDIFFSVDLSPTWVHGGFFVGVSAKLQGGEDRPARVDTNAAGDKSWFFYAPDIAATIDDLAAAPFGARMDDTTVVVLPGAFMVRASGEAVP
ncbi:MAG TPA: right-handed parallel beta-helix repeat-containing protein [Dokdonella sp.]